MKRVLVVGAGFSGAVIARELAEAGHNVTVLEKRDHIGGNAYDYNHWDDEGDYAVRIHKYGPHIFHTNNEKVFQWLSKFTEWVPYQHKVKALLSDGRYVTLPVNKETKEIVGEENIIDTFFRPYSEKMWGMKLEQISPTILNRIPVRDDMNELYFPDDKFQFMPKHGYSPIFNRMLKHKNIRVKLNTSFNVMYDLSVYDHVFNSMPIDEFFDFGYGALPYRSIKFTHQVLPMPRVLPTATVNFTHRDRYTRVTEWKNFPNHGHDESWTVLTFEEPMDYTQNNMERYYPVKDASGVNRLKYEQYKKLTPDYMTFIGRCGLYVYLDMDQAINSALAISQRYLNGEEQQ